MIYYNVYEIFLSLALYEHIQKETQHEQLRRNILNLKIDGSNKKSITKYLIPLAWNNLNSELKTIQKNLNSLPYSKNNLTNQQKEMPLFATHIHTTKQFNLCKMISDTVE